MHINRREYPAQHIKCYLRVGIVVGDCFDGFIVKLPAFWERVPEEFQPGQNSS
jgi:hypothetical protein